MDNFKISFNPMLMNFCAEPYNIMRQINREAQAQVDRTVEALKAKGEDYACVLARIQPSELKFEWSVNLDVGSETLAIYRKGWSVPIVVRDRSFPWSGTDNHEHMRDFLKHHFTERPESYERQGAEHAADMLNQLLIRWMEFDLGEVRRHNPSVHMQASDIGDIKNVE